MARVCKVLIVENDDHISQVLGEMLHDEGFLVSAVETGTEMEEQLNEDDFDIVVIDVTQPGDKDGFALAEMARAQGCGVILTTGDHRYGERLSQSGHLYLLKPFRMRDLMGLADRILTVAETECVRRKRRDGSSFQPRCG